MEPLEEVTVAKGKKSVQVLSYGMPPFGLDRGALVPNGYKCLTYHAGRYLIGESQVKEENDRPRYRFCDVKTCKVSEWSFAPTGALNDINEQIGNANHHRGYNGRLVLGVAFPSLQERIRALANREVEPLPAPAVVIERLEEDVGDHPTKRQRTPSFDFQAEFEALCGSPHDDLADNDFEWLGHYFDVDEKPHENVTSSTAKQASALGVDEMEFQAALVADM